MRKYLIIGFLLLFTLFSCTQYIWVPIPVGGNSEDEETGDIWDGTTDSNWYDPEQSSDTYFISTAEQLASLADLVNNQGETFKGKTVVLMDDINLDNILWTPIGPNADAAERFEGTFDGNGKVIRNLKVEQAAAYKAAGLFGVFHGTIKDLTIDGADITSISAPGSEGSTTNGIAVLAGSLHPSGKVENVRISNFSVSGNRYVGGIAGYSTSGGTKIKSCVVENGTLTATPDSLFEGNYDNGDKVGGIIGYCVIGDIVEGCSVNNVSLKGYRDVGGIIGYRDTKEDGDTTITNNKVSNISITIDGEYNYNSYVTEDDFDAGKIIGDTAGGEVDNSNIVSGCDINFINTDFV